MRSLLALTACLIAGCASRSALDRSPRGDATADDARDDGPAPAEDGGRDASVVDSELPDLGGETWSLEAGGPTCATREVSCRIGHDFGPSKGVADVFTQCSATVGAACGDLLMVFDADGCLVEVRDIREYSPAFVECVARLGGATRWECAAGKNLRMLQACP